MIGEFVFCGLILLNAFITLYSAHELRRARRQLAQNNICAECVHTKTDCASCRHVEAE